jgi:gas vesicle protein
MSEIERTASVNKYLKFVLRTAMNLIDEYSDQVERASDRVSGLVDRGKEMIYPEPDHTLRNVLSFAAGIGVGVGAAMLLAPSSGSELRQSIRDRVYGSSTEAA